MGVLTPAWVAIRARAALCGEEELAEDQQPVA